MLIKNRDAKITLNIIFGLTIIILIIFCNISAKKCDQYRDMIKEQDEIIEEITKEYLNCRFGVDYTIEEWEDFFSNNENKNNII